MSKGAINFSNDNEYYTPKSLLEHFGGDFDYDPATTVEKAEEFGITNYDTIETDGLKADWTKYKKIWINPPFTDKHLFLEKAVETYKSVKNDIYLLAPIEFLTTKRFHRLCSGAKVYIPNGRLKFESGLGKKSTSPAFGSIIIHLQDDWSLETLEINT